MAVNFRAADGLNETPVSAAAPLPVSGAAANIPAGATSVQISSGNVAAGSCAAALPAVSAKTNYCTGFQVTASGATTGLPVTVTLAGILGGTLTYTFVFPAGVLVPATPLVSPSRPRSQLQPSTRPSP
jgi:hypothetical protein